MRSWFLKRKNLGKLTDNEVKKVNYFPASLQNKTLVKRVILAVTYHPIRNSLNEII